MCGIVGALDLREQREFPEQRLSRMLGSVRHRGPDDRHVFQAPGIALGCQRLAILDPERGRQPLSDPSGRVWVAFNGELFNDAELKSELAKRGHRLSGHGDTQLWPALYLERGVELFERAEGQFATAIWDCDERRLLLGRDRFGICPLFYAKADGWLLFASEIKALLAAGLLEPRPDRKGVDAMFCAFAAGPRRTCFEGVNALAPGHFLEVTAGSLRERRYWELAFPNAGEERRDAEDRLLDELESIVESAVARRRSADAQVASYLSGGIDSALVAATARKVGPSALPAFSIGFDSSGPDERARSSLAAKLLELPLETLVPSAEEIVNAVPESVRAAESPILDMANPCLLLLARRVHERGYKVVLTGEGADEAMAGYVWHRAARFMSGRPARLIVRCLSSLLAPGTPASAAAEPAAPGAAQLAMYGALARVRAYFYSAEMTSALSEHDALSELDLDPERLRRLHPLNQALYVEYKAMLPGHLLLGKGDRVGMHSSVENRYPFLDEAFVRFCASLDPKYKLRNGQGKWLLRRLAKRVLPPPLANHPKTMFKAHSLCNLNAKPRFLEQLTCAESLRKTGYFSVEGVQHEQRLQRLLPSFAPRRFAADAAYTAVVTTQLWHHLFLGGGLCELPTWDSGL